MIGKLQRVPLREVWKHEALDFTQWLEQNIDILNESLDISLSGAEREKAAGAFSVDLVAEDDDGNPVVIENQLEKSDHNHLGKLITYLTAIGARTAIWIVSEPRPEHVAAIAWLNGSSSAEFYLLKVEAVKIGDSPPAPLLTLIVGPSEESRDVGATKKGLAERFGLRHHYWTELLDRAMKRTDLHSSISPGRYSWVGTSAGVRGLSLNYTIRKGEAGVELYIDRGKDTGDESKVIFDELESHKEAIEAEFGAQLEWQRLEGRRASRIAVQAMEGGYADESGWPDLQDTQIDAMIRLEAALRPRTQELKV